MVVYTRSQLENMDREEMTDELLRLSKLTDHIETLNIKLEEFSKKYDEVCSQLLVSKNCTDLLKKRVIQLEKTSLSTSQYIRREMIEVNPVPTNIDESKLEETICNALTMTGIEVSPDDLHACHRLKQKDKVIIKFKDRKKRHIVHLNRKKLNEKKKELNELGLSDKLYVQDSIIIIIIIICSRLMKSKRIYSTWFFHNRINLKLYEKSNPSVVYHKTDIESILGIDDIDALISEINRGC